LRRAYDSGLLPAHGLVWSEGMPEWIPFAEAMPDAIAADVTSGAPPESPYQAPRALVQPTAAQAQDGVAHARFLHRMGAYAFDYSLQFVLVIGSILLLAWGLFLAFADDRDPEALLGWLAVGYLGASLLLPVVALVYGALFEASRRQATPGKRLLGLRVEDLAGDRLPAGRAFLHRAASLLTGMTFGIGYLMAAFTEKRQTLHDLLAEVQVVEVDPARSARLMLRAITMTVLGLALPMAVGFALPFGAISWVEMRQQQAEQRNLRQIDAVRREFTALAGSDGCPNPGDAATRGRLEALGPDLLELSFGEETAGTCHVYMLTSDYHSAYFARGEDGQWHCRSTYPPERLIGGCDGLAPAEGMVPGGDEVEGGSCPRPRTPV
jgi:uncharacterized RDD family membrane protein YckC